MRKQEQPRQAKRYTWQILGTFVGLLVGLITSLSWCAQGGADDPGWTPDVIEKTEDALDTIKEQQAKPEPSTDTFLQEQADAGQTNDGGGDVAEEQ